MVLSGIFTWELFYVVAVRLILLIHIIYLSGLLSCGVFLAPNANSPNKHEDFNNEVKIYEKDWYSPITTSAQTK